MYSMILKRDPGRLRFCLTPWFRRLACIHDTNISECSCKTDTFCHHMVPLPPPPLPPSRQRCTSLQRPSSDLLHHLTLLPISCCPLTPGDDTQQLTSSNASRHQSHMEVHALEVALGLLSLGALAGFRRFETRTVDQVFGVLGHSMKHA